MIGKVKKWLGIEGVKLEIQVPEEWPAEETTLTGKLLLSSKNAQTVKFVKIVLIEKYMRGRRNENRKSATPQQSRPAHHVDVLSSKNRNGN